MIFLGQQSSMTSSPVFRGAGLRWQLKLVIWGPQCPMTVSFHDGRLNTVYMAEQTVASGMDDF